ncbi:MAG: hypothetical protein ACI4N4_02030 [Candidatus Fimenecus sp.]
MKFKDAYCTKIQRLLSIDEITHYYRFDKQFYKDNIEKHLICPECRQPNLSYHNDAPPYLSVYPGAKHLDDCTLKQDEMTPVQTETFVENPKNREQISRQLESVLTMMLDAVPTSHKKATPQKSKISSSPSDIDVHSKKSKKRIPRKRIDLQFTNEDFDCYKLFYGSVRLQWEKEDTEDYKILLRRQDKSDKRLLCRLKISSKVYSYLPNEFKTPREFNCNIVFLAKFSNKGRSYQDTWIKTSQYISLTKTNR